MLGKILTEQQRPAVRVTTTRLRDALRAGLERPANPAPPKSGDWFRCSGLPRLCPRMYGLAMRNALSLDMQVDAELGWVFGIGTAIHRQFQEEFLRSLPEGVFQGWWRNRATGYVAKGDSLPLGHNGDSLSHSWMPMPKGNSDDYEYVELSFRNEQYRLTGHCDGVLCWPGDEPEIFELKTINDAGYATVDPENGGKPKAEHYLQAQAYLWLSGLKRARIVYFCKRFGRFDDMLCEHTVERDERVIDDIKAMLEEAREVLATGATNALPMRLTECRSKSSDRAKYCPTKVACFTPSA